MDRSGQAGGGCAKEATGKRRAIIGASSGDGSEFSFVASERQLDVTDDGQSERARCGQSQSIGSSNQRRETTTITAAVSKAVDADQLATQANIVRAKELLVVKASNCTGAGCRVSGNNNKNNNCGGNSGDGSWQADAGPAASTVRRDGSFRIRSEHFSAAVNQFNYESSGGHGSGCGGAIASASQQKHDQAKQEVHEKLFDCRLIRPQTQEQDAGGVAFVTTKVSSSNDDEEQRRRRRRGDLCAREGEESRLLEDELSGPEAQVREAAGSCKSRAGASRHLTQPENKRQQQQQQRALSPQAHLKHGRSQLDKTQQHQQGANFPRSTTQLEDYKDCRLNRSEQQFNTTSNQNSSFWTRLSNLSRSILQQQQSLSCDSATSVTCAFDENTLESDLSNSFLAPEVLSYLANNSKRQQPGGELLEQNRPIGEGHRTQGATMTKTSISSRLTSDEPQQDISAVASEPSASRGLDVTEEMGKVMRMEDARKQQDQTASRRKRETNTAQVANKHVFDEQEMCQTEMLPRSGNGKGTISFGLHQPTISGSKTQQRQQQLKSAPMDPNELQLGGGASARHQVKLSITTNATNTTTTTTTTSQSSSASSLSSCILSESMSAQSNEVRLRWSKKMDFLLSIIGFAVDLANIWRFPYLVYKNGGGVFLIPYLIMFIFGGIPLFFLELCLGQYVKKGPITVWNKICPYMKGVGYCSILISWYVSFYYNVLIAWSVYFIYRSILSIGHKMPWEDCDNSWNSPNTCVSISQLKEVCSLKTNVTLESCRKEMFSSIDVTSPASEFFVKELSQIDQSTGLDDMGFLRPELVFCTMIVYLLHYFSLFRGLETSGKVVWVTATAPYMILSILLVRGLFLPGASMGIKYYLSPRMEKLADPQVWIDAAGQVFYSIGVGFGVHLTYASFNSHDNNCYRDCLTTSAVNALTSIFSGLVVFVYLGYMATNLGIEIDKVASEGYSLVFEVYPEALTTLPFARFWSILFFIMLLTLGIDSAMGGLEAVITGLEDEFKFAKRLSRGQLTGLVIISSFLPALISCTQGGAYTLFWFDIYSAGVSLLFSALFETIGVVYCYGLDKFILNIESMLGKRPQIFYIICWKFISPIFLLAIIFMSIYTASVPIYRGYTFPLWSVWLGWCLAFSSVAAVPIVAILTLYSNSGNKAISVSPSKSPRKANAASAISAASGGSRNVSRKSTPSHGGGSHHQCRKTVTTMNYSDEAYKPSGARATSSVINLPPDHQQHHHHCYKQGARIEEEML